MNTLKYLRFKQVYYRVYYIIRNKYFPLTISKTLTGEVVPINWQLGEISTQESVNGKTFTFLNRSKLFSNKIDWNYSKYGKLWTFNLNYFDFLNQKEINVKEGVMLIKDYISNDAQLKDGKESYTISLRGINWIKFLSKNRIEDNTINESLYNHYYLLLNNLELQFLGNHYLENGFSLLFGAYYFQDERLYRAGEKILIEELNEQILEDGAHMELSPMYHQTMLHRVLDCLNLVRNNNWKSHKLESFIEGKAIAMLSWLQKITFNNGNIPMVNDSTYGIAPSSSQLFDYANSLSLKWVSATLGQSGYRKYNLNNYELFVDVGKPGTDYLPAHIHSDTFSFELYVSNHPFIVDPGISTYEKNDTRQRQRSTSCHNTVQLGKYEQTEIWGGFRAARRARIVELDELNNKVRATHDGYRKHGIMHSRSFEYKNDYIKVTDNVTGKAKEPLVARFHFHPDVKLDKIENNVLKFKTSGIQLEFKSDKVICKREHYEYCQEFNKVISAEKVEVEFQKSLTTYIRI